MSHDASVGYLMNRAARLMRRLADRRLKPLGLSSGHLAVLTAFIDHAELSQKSLTELAAIEQPTMASTLARMERDGIIERRPDPLDGRSELISLTRATRGKMPAIQSIIHTMNEDALRNLPITDRAKFRRSVGTVIQSLDALLDGDDPEL